MTNYKGRLALQFNAGAAIETAARIAIDVSKRLGGLTVDFVFNGVACSVDSEDLAENIPHLYLVALRMGWADMGRARCVPLAIVNAMLAVDEKGQFLMADPKSRYAHLEVA